MNELQTTTQQVLWGFFLGAFALGWISQRTHFGLWHKNNTKKLRPIG